jgi:hypothetical protein
MTSPKNRNELRDLIVTALSPVEINRVERANAILDALEASGVACVPVEATQKMKDAWADGYHAETAAEDWRVMLFASPYRKGG